MLFNSSNDFGVEGLAGVVLLFWVFLLGETGVGVGLGVGLGLGVGTTGFGYGITGLGFTGVGLTSG